MFDGLAVILVVVWAVSWTVFHVAGGRIHRLLLFALIAAILHVVRDRSTG